MFEPSKLYKNETPLRQSFRIAVSIKDGDTTHYVIRSQDDLDMILLVLSKILRDGENDLASIKWVPIPDLEEVHHVQ